MNNEQIKKYSKLKQKKFRDEYNEFLIEGIHIVDECLKSKFFRKNILKIFLRKDFKDEKILNRIGNIDYEYLNEPGFNKLKETENSQGIIGLVSKTKHLPAVSDNIICALDNINDPGNLGTILRTCWWFGIENVLISKNSVDLYNSKVIRASQGAIFNLLINENTDLSSELNKFSDNNFDIILSVLDTNNFLSNFKFKKEGKYVIVFGNEAKGISEEILAYNKFKKLKIESYTKCESLNVASSAAIMFYELKKIIK